MTEVKINAEEIESLVGYVNNSVKELKPSISSINLPSGCREIMISEYYKQIKKISSLIESYKKLVEKDMKDIVKSKNKLVEMDSQITGNIVSGVDINLK